MMKTRLQWKALEVLSDLIQAHLPKPREDEAS